MGSFYCNYDDRDVETIKWQLGTDRVYILGVTDRCIHNFPSNILLFPVNDFKNGIDINGGDLKERFFKSISNPLWLTCPYLNREIHRLESRGFIEKISEFINCNSLYVSMMNSAHADYYYLRKSMYRQMKDVFFIDDDNMRVFNSGIGGIRDTDKLKCLHQHFAHYSICNKNIAGKVIYELLGKKIYCKDVICNKSL